MHRTIRRSWGRPWNPKRPGNVQVLLCGLLLAISLVSTSFDVHPHSAQDADHAVTAGGDHGELPVFSGASHPHQGPHMEPSGQRVTPHCPACLLHLQSQVDADHRAPIATVLSAHDRVRVPAPLHHGDPNRLPGGSRAPPLA